MRNEKILIKLLSDLVRLLKDEANRNPEFAARLDHVLEALPSPKDRTGLRRSPKHTVEIPDIHAEWNRRGEHDFRLWLRELPLAELRALIRAHDLDSTRRTVKWKEVEKLSEYIADALKARLSRGSAFLGRGGDA